MSYVPINGYTRILAPLSQLFPARTAPNFYSNVANKSLFSLLNVQSRPIFFALIPALLSATFGQTHCVSESADGSFPWHFTTCAVVHVHST